MKLREVKKLLNIKETTFEEMDEDYLAMYIGGLIIECRLIKGITQEELAKLVGTKQPSIARLENGSQLPSIGFLYKIAKALDTYLIPPSFGLIEPVNKKDLICGRLYWIKTGLQATDGKEHIMTGAAVLEAIGELESKSGKQDAYTFNLLKGGRLMTTNISEIYIDYPNKTNE